MTRPSEVNNGTTTKVRLEMKDNHLTSHTTEWYTTSVDESTTAKAVVTKVCSYSNSANFRDFKHYLVTRCTDKTETITAPQTSAASSTT